jgi:hypothetical protein
MSASMEVTATVKERNSMLIFSSDLVKKVRISWTPMAQAYNSSYLES